MQSNCYRRCKDCGTTYQWLPETGYFGGTHWGRTVQSVRCQRCHNHLYYGVEKTTYCKNCDQFVLTYGCCPKCGSTRSKGLSESCFLTTACVVSKGLPDDCYELTTLRTWRDKLEGDDEEFSQRVKDYYTYAPKIVEKINSLENSKEIYDEIYEELVLKTVELLNKNKIPEAAEHYLKFYLSLKEKYL